MQRWGTARLLAAVTMTIQGAVAAAAPMPAEKAAALFGARPAVEQISLSPDGRQIAFIAPMRGDANVLLVAPTQGEAKPVLTANKVLRLRWCGWSSVSRIVCTGSGTEDGIPYSRALALDSTGANQIPLARRSTGPQLRISQYDGHIIDWMSGSDGTVLMTRDFVPEVTTGSRMRSDKGGLGVERVDTRTLRAARVEGPREAAGGYIADGQGRVRIMIAPEMSSADMLTGRTSSFYREPDGAGVWKPLVTDDKDGNGWRPIAVDPGLNKAYALHKLDGRYALYRVSLDGQATKELVFAHPSVDVDDVIQVGRSARVVGATYATERRDATYFDPAYATLTSALAKAVPGLPLINFIGASADETILLIRASSDVDPGRYYVFDRTKRDLTEVLAERPGLIGETLAPVRPITYRAADGTMVPAYLTLPAGGTKGLPAIVMPHGGPSARDEWGFDWLAQFYAARGYAVLQPNFRGSAGYGDQWFSENGFKAWRTAIGDVAAAGQWLVSEGIAAPGRLAIVGWSYGGYAALQSAVVSPDLFKAVVAIAPVTDLGMLRAEKDNFTSASLVRSFIGTGPHIVEGSPLRRAGEIRAPVMLFHGDADMNVAVAESREMDQALRKAGAKTSLVVYPGLDHQLPDSAARADMLKRSDAFLRTALGL